MGSANSPMMFNLGELVAATQRNCHISDARHAADYTLCVFLLKMREYYRWENDIPLNQPLAKDAVADWLQEREAYWESIESNSFEHLSIDGTAHDPFDAAEINRALVPNGYVYSAGYGAMHKPGFFLGALARSETRDNCTILVSGCEYARELAAPPAMLQGRTIYVRLESVSRFIWEKIEESNWHHNRDAMDRALGAYGFNENSDTAVARMTESESEAMILHEIGELRAGDLLGPRWEQMLAGITRPHAEIMARALRDILADNLVTLPVLIEQGNWPSLHFYFANFGGMRRHLYPDLMEAYRAAVAAKSTDPLAQRINDDRRRWESLALTAAALVESDSTDIDCSVESLLAPNHA